MSSLGQTEGRGRAFLVSFQAEAEVPRQCQGRRAGPPGCRGDRQEAGERGV